VSRNVHVKMCGLKRPDDVRHAVFLGADYLGFVFAPGGPRALEPAEAERMLRGLETGPARRVGVFRDATATFINEVVERCGLDLVQLHGHEPRDFPSALGVPVLRALRIRAVPESNDAAVTHDDGAATVAGGLPLAPNVEAVLLDPEDSSGQSGGLGLAADPEAIAGMLATLPVGTRVFLSGGLTPANVAAVVRTFRPFAVDVSSGIEAAPGVKDAVRMTAFIAALEERA